MHGRRVASPLPDALARERPPTRQLTPIRAGAPFGPLIVESDLPPSLLSQAQHPLSAWESTERDLIVQSLLDHGGDRAKAAKALGISRATIYRKITAYGIRLGPEKG